MPTLCIILIALSTLFIPQDYIAVKEKYARYLPHSAGRYAAKRFRKAQCPIVERLTNSLMMKGRNNGKKLMAVRIVKHAFEIIYLLTDKNPLSVSVCSSVFPFYCVLNVLARAKQFHSTNSYHRPLGVDLWTRLNFSLIYSSVEK